MKNWKFGIKIKDILNQHLMRKLEDKLKDEQFREEIHKRAFPGYLVIGRNAIDAGIFSDYLVFLGEIEFAVARGYIPIIDLLNYPRYCIQDKNNYYKENSWEYFFEQPCGVGMEQIKDLGGHIVYAPANFGGKVFHGVKMHRIWNENASLFHYWKEIAQKYIRFNEPVLKELQTEFINMFKDNIGKIVGVAIREGYGLAKIHRKHAGGGV